MFSTLRNRFGIPGVISVIALVFALVGGAFAANDLGGSGKGATTSAKKSLKGPRGPRGPKGATGAAGPAGPAGAAGAKGDAGAAGAAGEKGAPGTAGAAGANGKTVLNGTGIPASGLGTVGDFYIDTSTQQIYGPKTGSGWGAPTSLKGTNGAKGEPWVVGTAPSGVLMKGTWAVQPYMAAAAGENIPVAFSTGVPVPKEEILIDVVPPGGPDPLESVFGPQCTGSAENPTPGQLPGILCVYAQSQTNLKTWSASDAFETQVRTSGGGAVALLKAAAAGEVTAFGSWAMLTPNSP